MAISPEVDVQALARDAVRAPLSVAAGARRELSRPRKSSSWGRSHDNSSRPTKLTINVPSSPNQALNNQTLNPSLRTTHNPRHGLSITQCPHCDRQRQRHNSSWFRRRRCAQMLLPVIRGTAEACADNGGRIGGRCIHRTTSTTIQGAVQDQLPIGARHCHRLGRHGEDMAIRLHRRTEDG